MNFLKITDKDDEDHYINFDLVCSFSTEDYLPVDHIPAEYLIRFVQVHEGWLLKFKDKQDRDNKVSLISNFLKLR